MVTVFVSCAEWVAGAGMCVSADRGVAEVDAIGGGDVAEVEG